jgi:hypothetical protein
MVQDAMSNGASDAAKSANTDYTGWETGALNGYNNDINQFTSNVNSQISAGNPYQSQQYLQNRNIATSGAMDSANTKAAQQTRDAALRTGTNTASVAASNAENARAGQRQLTDYNATSDTQNEDKWLSQQDKLTQEQLQGANSEAGMFGAEESGRASALNNLTTLQGQDDALWQAGIGAVGTAGGAAIGKA